MDRVLVPQRLDAHKLIEEFMILANVSAAETLEKAKSDLIYRVHDEPSLEKMRALSEVLASIALKMPTQGPIRPELFNRILRAWTDPSTSSSSMRSCCARNRKPSIRPTITAISAST